MATRMQQRRGTAAQWLSTNNGNGPVLNIGEIGYESDTNKFKIGDGVSHWVDLNYFADAVELGGNIDDYIPLTQKGAANGVATLNSDGVIPANQIPSLVGLDTEISSAVNTAVSNLVNAAPAALNTLGELAAALNNDEDFSSTVASELSLKASTEYVDNEIDTLTSTLTSDISTAVTTHNQDTTGVHGIADTSALVTLSGTQTIANKTLQSPTVETGSAGSVITPTYTGINGVTSAGNASAWYGFDGANGVFQLGPATGLVSAGWTDATSQNISSYVGQILVVEGPLNPGEYVILGATVSSNPNVPGWAAFNCGTLSQYDASSNGMSYYIKSPNTLKTISSTEISYLDGVTSNIQTQLDAKVSTSNLTELAQDAVGNAVGTGLSYNDSTGAISVDETIIDSNISAALVAPTISTSLTLDGSGDFTIAADANIVLDATTEVYIGSASSGNEVAIKSYVDAAVGNVDLSTKQDVVSGVSNTEIGYLDGVTSAIQTQLDDKAPIASPTFTGTATTDDLVVNGDFTVNGTNFAASATSITIEDNIVQLAHQNAANTVDLGLVVAYNDGSTKHAGIVRDVSDAKWKLFKGVSTEPSTVVAFGEGSLDDLAVAVLEATSISATSATIGDVSNTELQYLNGVTSAIQTQLDAKAPLASPTFTGTVTLPNGTVTHDMIANGTIIDADINASAAIAQSKISGLTADLAAKSNVVSTINAQTGNYTLVLSDADKVVEMNVGSANTLTVPANADAAIAVGTRIHIVQTGSGQTTITPGSGVTVNGTPGLKSRAQWSAITLLKRATNTWVAFGDLTA